MDGQTKKIIKFNVGSTNIAYRRPAELRPHIIDIKPRDIPSSTKKSSQTEKKIFLKCKQKNVLSRKIP